MLAMPPSSTLLGTAATKSCQTSTKSGKVKKMKVQDSIREEVEKIAKTNSLKTKSPGRLPSTAPWNDRLPEKRRDMQVIPTRMYNNKWVELCFCLPQKLHKRQFLNILSSIIYFVHSINE